MADNDKKKSDDEVSWPTLESFTKLAPQPSQPSAERRRAPRRDIEDQGVQMVGDAASFSVVDLSTDGIGIRLEDATHLLSFAVGSIVQGQLKLSGQLYPFRAVVRHQRVGIVGCQFQNPSNELKAEVGKLLDPTFLGKKLKPFPHKGDASRAYLGPGHTAAFFWETPTLELERFTIYVLGFFAAYAVDHGLSTGTVRVLRKPETHEPIDPLEWSVLAQDRQASPEKLELARDLIRASELPANLMRETIRLLGV
jgi:hypothetical protein